VARAFLLPDLDLRTPTRIIEIRGTRFNRLTEPQGDEEAKEPVTSKCVPRRPGPVKSIAEKLK
jgi:hypothetical protein